MIDQSIILKLDIVINIIMFSSLDNGEEIINSNEFNFH